MRKLLFAAAVLILAATLNAQEIRFGVKGGLNIGFLKTKYDGSSEKSGSLTSFYLGARTEYGMSEKMSIQGELLYQTFGGKYQFDGQMEEDKIKLSELSLPIVLKYYIVPQKLSVNGGISLGFIIKATYEDNAPPATTSDIKDEIKTLNLGISIGAEYRITDNIFADLRFNKGLTNLYNGPGGGTDKATVLQIGVGYRF